MVFMYLEASLCQMCESNFDVSCGENFICRDTHVCGLHVPKWNTNHFECVICVL